MISWAPLHLAFDSNVQPNRKHFAEKILIKCSLLKLNFSHHRHQQHSLIPDIFLIH